MQFNDESPDIVGDLEIKPRGVAAVMQKEVRTQRLTALLQTVANPMLAPFIKIPNLMRELAISQDIDPDLLVNDVNEAQLYAQMLKGMMADAQAGATQEAGAAD
jgi:preprotein translocase subunit SecB